MKITRGVSSRLKAPLDSACCCARIPARCFPEKTEENYENGFGCAEMCFWVKVNALRRACTENCTAGAQHIQFDLGMQARRNASRILDSIVSLPQIDKINVSAFQPLTLLPQGETSASLS